MLFSIYFISIIFHATYCFHQTPLDDYVKNEFDIKHVSFKIVSMQIRENNIREYLLDATTLKWLESNFELIKHQNFYSYKSHTKDPNTSQNVWRHDLFVYAPNNRRLKETGFLYIGNGYNDNRGDNDLSLKNSLISLSNYCDCIVALLKQVPNQPIKFKVNRHSCNLKTLKKI